MPGGLSQGVWTGEAQGRVMEWAAEAVGLSTCRALLEAPPSVIPVREWPAEEVRSVTVTRQSELGQPVTSRSAGCCGH